VAFGEVEDYQLKVDYYDYGDVPSTYENDKDGVSRPANHIQSTLYLGKNIPDVELSPSSVSSGADNNGTNGDGEDEDAIIVSSNQIRKGIPYTLNIPVSATAAQYGYLYGWIDFNNNGKFEASEIATASPYVINTEQPVTLTWTGIQTGSIVGSTEKLYMRIRVANRTLYDYTGATGGTTIDERSIGSGAISAADPTNATPVSTGEVEDYQIDIVTTYDYGDVPSTYENDKDGSALPALHAPLNGFTLGDTIDYESTAASVASGSDNNGTNGDGMDEDMISSIGLVSRGIPYELVVPVNIPESLTVYKYVYGWLDLNGDGRFQANEFVESGTYATGKANVTLTWTAAQTNTITSGTQKIYLRVRLSNLLLTDYTGAAGGTTIDERSIGNGATNASTSTNNPAVAFGEVEDYQLKVDYYDYGDVPSTYENDKDGVSRPAARQLSNSILKLGATIDDESNVQSVASGSDNNGKNGDGEDEDAINPLINSIIPGTKYTLEVAVTNTTGSAKTLYGWIDFNNNGKFESIESTSVSVVSNTTSANLVWESGVTSLMSNSKVYLRLRISNNTLADNTSTADYDERALADGLSTGVYGTSPGIGEIEDYLLSSDIQPSYCYKDAATLGTVLETKHGITALGRAGSGNADNWPMVRKGAWTALEAKTKGFVPNRVPFDGSGNPVGIISSNFVEGMMVYDTTNNCLKIYNGTAWKCYTTQTCPD
jgi:hypothetical protein